MANMAHAVLFYLHLSSNPSVDIYSIISKTYFELFNRSCLTLSDEPPLIKKKKKAATPLEQTLFSFSFLKFHLLFFLIRQTFLISKRQEICLNKEI